MTNNLRELQKLGQEFDASDGRDDLAAAAERLFDFANEHILQPRPKAEQDFADPENYWHRAVLAAAIPTDPVVEGFASALESGDFANVAEALNQRMCCDGHMCGCQGSSVGEYLAHELRAAYRGEVR